MIAHGWSLYTHRAVMDELLRLVSHAQNLKKIDEKRFQTDRKVQILRKVIDYIYDIIPSDPFKAEYRIGKTMTPEYKNWRRAKKGLQRYRLYFLFQSEQNATDRKKGNIAYAWLNNEKTLRKMSEKSNMDAYAVMQNQLKRGRIPDQYCDLIKQCKLLKKKEELTGGAI